MTQVITATYKNGAFVPDVDCGLTENTQVRITIEPQTSVPPTVTNPKQRQAVLQEIFDLMDRNPIPLGAPRRFTREELHERR